MLNENNVTGLDFETARNNIYNLFENVKLCEKRLNTVFYYLFEKLSISWASEKAVNFYNTFSNIIEMFNSIYYEEFLTVYNNTKNSYNIVALANGAPTIENNNYYFDKIFNLKVKELQSNINGIIGMNISYIETLVLPEFKLEIKKAISTVENIQTELKLFDIENNQKQAYIISLTKAKNKIIW